MSDLKEVIVRDYHDAIAKAAAVKDLDVEKLTQLAKLQEDWDKRQAATRFNEAMAAAQGEMSQISKDSTNPQTRSMYASLPALDRAIRPIYTRLGFSVSFDEEKFTESGISLVAYVSCGAETRPFRKGIPIVTKGFRGQEMMTQTHAAIAAVTYGRRALLKMIFNLAEEDDDGNFAAGRPNLPASNAKPLRTDWRSRDEENRKEYEATREREPGEEG